VGRSSSRSFDAQDLGTAFRRSGDGAGKEQRVNDALAAAEKRGDADEIASQRAPRSDGDEEAAAGSVVSAARYVFEPATADEAAKGVDGYGEAEAGGEFDAIHDRCDPPLAVEDWATARPPSWLCCCVIGPCASAF